MNNPKKTKKQGKNYKNQITRRISFQYILVLTGFIAGFLLLAFLAWRFLTIFTWQPDDPLYILFSFVKKYIIVFAGVPLFIGWAWITYRFMGKPLRYLDDIITASEALANHTDTQILLPDEMKTVQDELNQVRENALRNEKLAKDEEQRKNDLIVYLAHDLKTPLTSVIGYLTLLRDEPGISQELRAKYTGIALNKAERLEELINEFFDITRFNLTTMSLDCKNINLSRMLEQITNEFDPILAEKGLHWATEIQPGIEIICDSDKLERVFDNLIRNAVNYSYTQTDIHLSMLQYKNNVKIQICNRGKTIAPEKLSRIFEQFFRLDSSRSSATGGAGLGLAISKEIVELHGGTIAVQSADENITFTVLLPVDRHKIV